MDATNQQKLLDAGFTIIRKEDQPTIRVKYKNATQREWKTLESNFQSKASRDRYVDMLLKNRMTVED
jgi:hypothetical protein